VRARRLPAQARLLVPARGTEKPNGHYELGAPDSAPLQSSRMSTTSCRVADDAGGSRWSTMSCRAAEWALRAAE
jgi:hypothetical protein